MERVKRIGFAAGVAAITLFGCQQAFAECGIASTYWEGTRTANGEHYNPAGISAAHKSLPFGTRVLVKDQHTGRSIVVRINDRGPYVRGRIIDLSTGAKNALGMDGLAPVCISVLSTGNGARVVEAAYHPRHARHSRLAETRHHHRYAGVRHPYFHNVVYEHRVRLRSHAARRRGPIAYLWREHRDTGIQHRARLASYPT